MSASYYFYNADPRYTSVTTPMVLYALNAPFVEYNRFGNIGGTTLSQVSNVNRNFGWLNFLLPSDHIQDLINGTKVNNGFGLRCLNLPTTCYYKILHSKEFGNTTLRPKMKIIYDMPEYVHCFFPNQGAKIRPTNSYKIAWHSNSSDLFKIELLKDGVVIDVIAENIKSSPYEWVFAQHDYVADTNYSIRVATSLASSSNDSLFEILSFDPHLSVVGGEGTGDYSANDTVAILWPNSDAYLYTFIKWSGDTEFVADINCESTIVVMPDADVAVTANYGRALMKIPGTIQAKLYFEANGQWDIGDGNFLHDYISPDSRMAKSSDYLTYGVSVMKSGKYQVVTKFITLEYMFEDTFSIYFTNIANDDNFMVISDAMANKQGTRFPPPARSMRDTVFLSADDYTFKVNLNSLYASIYKYEQFMPKLSVHHYSYEIIKEGTVLTVENGTGDGIYSDGEVIAISATTPNAGGTFKRWKSKTGLIIADTISETTTVVMGSGDCVVAAIFEGNVANIDTKSQNLLSKKFINVSIQNGHIITSVAGDYFAKPFNIQIFDLTGKLIYTKREEAIGNKSFLIPTTNFSAGLYIIKIKYLDIVATQKIVINR